MRKNIIIMKCVSCILKFISWEFRERRRSRRRTARHKFAERFMGLKSRKENLNASASNALWCRRKNLFPCEYLWNMSVCGRGQNFRFNLPDMNIRKTDEQMKIRQIISRMKINCLIGRDLWKIDINYWIMSPTPLYGSLFCDYQQIMRMRPMRPPGKEENCWKLLLMLSHFRVRYWIHPHILKQSFTVSCNPKTNISM